MYQCPLLSPPPDLYRIFLWDCFPGFRLLAGWPLALAAGLGFPGFSLLAGWPFALAAGLGFPGFRLLAGWPSLWPRD